VKRVKFFFPGNTRSFILDKAGAVLKRTEWLAGMANGIKLKGGEIRPGAEVAGVGESYIQLKDEERIDYDILIGADGPNSLIARYLGIKHKFLVASQCKVTFDTSNLDYLEFYLDKKFSPAGSWIFPKDKVINVGMQGDFEHLDAFLRYKGLDRNEVIEREAGVIPITGIQNLAHHNVALIGDSASMPNPASGGGLSPIIYASRILARNIRNLKNYEREIKEHPIAAPVLLKARHILLELTNKDLANIGNFLTGIEGGEIHSLSGINIIKYRSLVPKLENLLTLCKAMGISMCYGW